MTSPPREDEIDVDGHRWHSPEYVADWIRTREVDPPERRALAKRRLDAILEAIPHDRRAPILVLDLGAGWGRLAGRVLDTFPSARLVALDFSQPMREQARRRLADHADRLEAADGDLEQPGVVAALGRRFDVVVTSATLHHVSTAGLEHLYREVYEVLAPGGVFVNLDRVRRRAVALVLALGARASAGPVAARALARPRGDGSES